MPGATVVQGFPYPLLTEAATPVSAQNLATEVDTELTAADAARTPVLTRPSARASQSGTQTININTSTVMTYNTENWDTGGLFVIGSPTQMTIVSAGSYYLSASYQALGGADTDAWYDVGILVNATLIGSQKRPQYGTWGTTDDRWVSVSLMFRLAAADVVTARAFWNGSAGVSRNILGGSLEVRFVCP